jgi:hypothetical protein
VFQEDLDHGTAAVASYGGQHAVWNDGDEDDGADEGNAPAKHAEALE